MARLRARTTDPLTIAYRPSQIIIGLGLRKRSSIVVSKLGISSSDAKKILLSKNFRKKVGRAVLAALDGFFKHIDDLAAR